MSGKVQITVLVENTAHDRDLLAEHGLAFWISLGRHSVLFDTGQRGILASNAYRLDVPLRTADAIVISHGHYDHTGGFADAIHPAQPAVVYIHPAAFEPKFARNDDGTAREIGIPAHCEKAVRQRAETLVKTESPTAVADGLTVTGPIPRRTALEDTGGPFFLDRQCREPDPLVDDQAIFFEAAEGTVVILGCAHAGVINTLQYIQELTNGKPVHAVLGGMHLLQASPDRLSWTIEEFRKLGIERLYPAHCTGMAATVALWNAFPGKCFPCHVGTTVEFETA